MQVSGPIVDKIGRRRLFIAAACIHNVGAFIQAFGRSFGVLVVGRMVAGVSLGIFAFLVPLYQSELARHEHRGRMITFYQLGVTAGFCVAYWVAYATFNLKQHFSWELPILLQIGPSTILLLGIPWAVPETPRWLVYKGRRNSADAILSKLRMRRQEDDHEKVVSSPPTSSTSPLGAHGLLIAEEDHDRQEEMESHLGSSPSTTASSDAYSLDMEYLGIIQDVSFERHCPTSYASLLTKGNDNNRKRLFLGMGLHIMTQFTGINALLFHLPHIMETMGLAEINAMLIGNAVSGMVNMLATILVFFYIDRWGRRRILMVGALAMCVCMVSISIILAVYSDSRNEASRSSEMMMYVSNPQATMAVLVLLCLFLACFAMTWAAIGWIFPAEIYSQRIRAKAMGVTTGSMFGCSLLVTQVAPYLFDVMAWKAYVVFACLVLVDALLVHFFYPETKAKTLEEIQLLFSGALVDQTPKAHHPATAAEAWEKIEELCRSPTSRSRHPLERKPGIMQKNYDKAISRSDEPPTAKLSDPLPSILTDFMAIMLCDMVPCRPRHDVLFQVNGQPLPELMYFIQMMTFGGEINCRTALVALIYLERAKLRLPSHAVGSPDTSHRLFLASLLLASKLLQGSTWTTATLTKHRVYKLCRGLYSYREIESIERGFLKLIEYQCWVDDRDLHHFIMRHRSDLAF
ncbi:hypothetical protein DM01DRAFT_1407876 [Hesseltinella vesiculosa]|uniref:Major facilitator superfamily (MFS) profile domain-containing protein n=1 Tax=Hesseltinella vesiculosa TaxID=101127 RepID=A0A1X2GGE4_9FUNG|nr:hypothetical protein DM01DRAFT_1407876 [Hesseltinella vesiculosa]